MTTRPRDDRFPTRTATPAHPLVRTDPVVYSSGAGPLGTEQLDSYATNGYISLDGLLDAELVEDLLVEVERLAVDRSVRGSELAVIEPDSDVVRSVFDVHRISPLIADLVADPRVVGPARQVLGSEVYIHQSRVNRKPAFHGRDFYWHSDFETWHAEDGMPAMRAVSLSIALTANDATNGSLMVIPQSHRTFVPTVGDTPIDHFQRSLRRQEVGVPDEAGLLFLAEQGGGVDLLTGGPGSAVLFDSNLMHGSTGNMTPYGRTNLFVVYNSVDNVLEAPYAATTPRPQFVANRQPVAVGSARATPDSSSVPALHVGSTDGVFTGRPGPRG